MFLMLGLQTDAIFLTVQHYTTSECIGNNVPKCKNLYKRYMHMYVYVKIETDT